MCKKREAKTVNVLNKRIELDQHMQPTEVSFNRHLLGRQMELYPGKFKDQQQRDEKDLVSLLSWLYEMKLCHLLPIFRFCLQSVASYNRFLFPATLMKKARN